jgi:hypothetical protein
MAVVVSDSVGYFIAGQRLIADFTRSDKALLQVLIFG